ncbi:similar to Saccharomyces cerevisiae YNR051C BRE5 Ubiquitin protease cofactor [Maudiozyma barnettii]|uniref:Similar to Saccharomyces cerevisiae YNR051C BRE5 Ubiquitin protease cofactor n=1 Tax=Maudiozyma barnettii TaxID=61262 RepID=A0A8H2VGW7_9SACH|nr:Bre5p [Kazachstania barnettii]CAB4255439.1 similar to Saccharomyces cerevisiae YNR051C BRE5 Ubiquitin protease cofactor [Kazachstania barnettii]CAD1783881.1 similar to Saccharomyces cerevisiae YNR051C BRE5 Ubiquitin protease cofactor [Kazachstania barnettii]
MGSSVQDIAYAFLQTYYERMKTNPGKLSSFYSTTAELTHINYQQVDFDKIPSTSSNTLTTVKLTGKDNISRFFGRNEEKICDLKLKLDSCDFQSTGIAHKGIIIIVTGELFWSQSPIYKFCQMFVLTPLAKNSEVYDITNDIIRFLPQDSQSENLASNSQANEQEIEKSIPVKNETTSKKTAEEPAKETKKASKHKKDSSSKVEDKITENTTPIETKEEIIYEKEATPVDKVIETSDVPKSKQEIKSVDSQDKKEIKKEDSNEKKDSKKDLPVEKKDHIKELSVEKKDSKKDGKKENKKDNSNEKKEPESKIDSKEKSKDKKESKSEHNEKTKEKHPEKNIPNNEVAPTVGTSNNKSENVEIPNDVSQSNSKTTVESKDKQIPTEVRNLTDTVVTTIKETTEQTEPTTTLPVVPKKMSWASKVSLHDAVPKESRKIIVAREEPSMPRTDSNRNKKNNRNRDGDRKDNNSKNNGKRRPNNNVNRDGYYPVYINDTQSIKPELIRNKLIKDFGPVMKMTTGDNFIVIDFQLESSQKEAIDTKKIMVEGTEFTLERKTYRKGQPAGPITSSSSSSTSTTASSSLPSEYTNDTRNHKRFNSNKKSV